MSEKKVLQSYDGIKSYVTGYNKVGLIIVSAWPSGIINLLHNQYKLNNLFVFYISKSLLLSKDIILIISS